MAAGGIRDILVANQLFGPRKMQRLVEVCRQADLIVTVDHPDQVRAIGEATHAAGLSARAIVEVDIGLHRAGVAPDGPAVELGRAVEAQPGLELAGMMGYEGHLLTIEDPEQKEREIRAALGQLIETRDAFLAAGLPCPIVSAGGTGSYAITMTQPGITELQAGGLIFMDAFYRQKCRVEAFDFALKLVCTVVSRPVPARAVIDAGRKSVHADHATPLVVGHEHHIRVARLSAEHGELDLDESAHGLRIGDRLELIPGYSDMTNVLHNQFYGIRDGRVEAVWPLLARGKLQ